GDVPAARIPGVVDLLDSGAPASSRPYLAISRQFLLVGPETALGRDAVPRARAAVETLRGANARFVARAGDSIDLYTLDTR
ncbi:MAG TPA: hypothetical protein VGR00_04915, partial [Thermoanaerobaculia bacterium]|nr:hypothetical protein [Thermoanaerobaculia bacterium]